MVFKVFSYGHRLVYACRLTSFRKMSAVTVEKVTSAILLGEGPHWDAETKSLYYVDIMGPAVHRYIPSTNEHFHVQLDEVCSLVVPVADQPGKFITTKKNKLLLLSWDGKSKKAQSVEVIGDPEPERKDNRFNDGKADPKGRLWAGTMIGNENMFTKGCGGLYCLYSDKKINKQQTVGLSNGMGWSLDGKTMYYVDTLENTVDAFDYDLEKGLISNRRVIFDLPKSGVKGALDGFTLDTEGKLWLAIWAGAKVIRMDPTDGKILTSVSIPADKVTSVIFGGPNLDELYVTTAREALSEAELKAKPDSGCVFRVKGLGVKGVPSINVKLN